MAAHTEQQIMKNFQKELLALINGDWAVIDLLRMFQGDKSAMEFLEKDLRIMK